MPEVDENLDLELEAKFDKFMEYRDVILKRLEEARAEKIIGKSFNAKLTITLDSESAKIFKTINDPQQLLIVSQIEFVDGDKFDCKVENATGDVCARCWMIVPKINENELCPRCQSIINKLK
jgi:isoleucyl-tRNA synthetase